MRWNWNVWSLKLPLIWTKRIWSHYLDSMLSSLTILFHHSLLSSVQIDHIIHIICDYQYFRPKTHINSHSNNEILVLWQSVDMTWTWNPRYAQDKPLSSSIWKVTPKAKHWEGQVQILSKGFLTQEEKAQVVIIWCVCVLCALVLWN